MQLPINHNKPEIMHIDLNSCFATLEQQAYPNLRDKPLVIAAYPTDGGCIVSPSIKAKEYGIKTGMPVRDARLLCRNIIVRTPNVALIRDAHRKFKRIISSYSSHVVAKSIDEIIVDFAGTLAFHRKTLLELGQEIKARIRKEVGEYVSCNVGVGTNRFLAKVAASLHKPDGLDQIDVSTLRYVYSHLKLVDLPGINTRFEARLNACNILTPLDFLDAEENILHYNVFKSVVGQWWYLKIRGYEADCDYGRKSYGQSYALREKTCDIRTLQRLLQKLVEKMGRRLRRAGFHAYGVHVGMVFDDLSYWHLGRKFHSRLWTSPDLFSKACLLLNKCPHVKRVRELAVSCFDLETSQIDQPSLFDSDERKVKVQKAVDMVNDRWGEFVVTPLRMMGMQGQILDRISFGNVKDIEDVYSL